MANISTIKVGDTSYGITATPTAHASTATTYGAASASNYGHVKLSDNYTSSAGAAASGIGASSLAVYNAYNALNSNLSSFLIVRRLSLNSSSSMYLYPSSISGYTLVSAMTNYPQCYVQSFSITGAQDTIVLSTQPDRNITLSLVYLNT